MLLPQCGVDVPCDYSRLYNYQLLLVLTIGYPNKLYDGACHDDCEPALEMVDGKGQ